MIAADALRLTVLIGLSFRWFPSCRYAGSEGVLASHVARHSEQGAVPPVRRRPERRRRSKAQGKIKGRGTRVRKKSVCTWGWRGTPEEMAACREGAQYRIGFVEVACFVRRTALALDGAES